MGVSTEKDDLPLAPQGIIDLLSENKSSVLRHAVEDTLQWQTSSSHCVSIVDPEYVTLTPEKIELINVAIKEMDLTVIEDYELFNRVPGDDSSDQVRDWLNDIYRLSSQCNFIPADEAHARYRAHPGPPIRDFAYDDLFPNDDMRDLYIERLRQRPTGDDRTLVDNRAVDWPSQIHPTHGKQWIPRLLHRLNAEGRAQPQPNHSIPMRPETKEGCNFRPIPDLKLTFHDV